MATSDLDDLMPRPLPKPSRIEEMCTRPEVPEVSLVFDSISGTANKISSPFNHLNNSVQQHQTSSLLDSNCFIPRLDHHHASLSGPKPPNSPSFANTAQKTPLKLDDRSVLAAKKVSFSPHSPKTDTNILELNGIKSRENKNENVTHHCNHDTIANPQLQHGSINVSEEKKCCPCSSCSNDNFDYTWDHSSSIHRVMKNLERKVNTKVSYDDLQKTELKIENILLKHKCKYDKLGENCVSKEEFNRIIKNYENQINLLQLRVEELAQKLSYSPHFINTSCNHGIRKCDCSDCLRKSPPKSAVNAVNYLNHNCCGSHRIPTGNHFENNANYVNNDVISSSNHAQLNVKSTKSNNQEVQQLENCHQNCCHDRQNFKPISNHNFIHGKNPTMENHVVMHATNSLSPSEQCNSMPPSVHKSSVNQLVTQHQSSHYSNEPQKVPLNHQSMLSERNEDQLLLNTEKNIRLDCAFYNNIVENVKNLMLQNTKLSDSNPDTVELIKKATFEQFQKMGVNFDHSVPNEKISSNDRQSNKLNPSNSFTSPDLSFRLNSVAMKYVSENSPDTENLSKKSSVNDVSFRSNCNNVSIATLQYMERYQLLPSSEQKYGGNSAGFNKCEQNIAQEHRLYTHKSSQNNDRSFIY